MRVEILILSYAPDAGWLTYCLRSLQKYASGFSRIAVVYPDRDDEVMRSLCERYGATPVPHDEPPRALGHLAQNLAKCRADLYCPEASHVVHIDSDCVLTGPTKAEDFFVDGKPVLYKRTWQDAADAIVWRGPTRDALGWEPAWETMPSIPLVFDRRVYAGLRHHVETVHRMEFSKYVFACKPTFPYGFSEFNALGNFAVEKMPDLCHIVHAPPYPTRPIRQLWSHGEITPQLRGWFEDVLTHGERVPPPPSTPMTDERRKIWV